MGNTTLATAVSLCAWSVVAACGSDDPNTVSVADTRPQVIATEPMDHAVDVDPSLTELRAVFDRTMRDNNWSWASTDAGDPPEVTGDPYFEDDARTINVLPVHLEPGRDYLIWINSADHDNFKDEEGVSAAPFALSFSTSAQ